MENNNENVNKSINSEPYYCIKCHCIHSKGKIFIDHKKFKENDNKKLVSNKINNTLNEICNFESEDILIPKESLKIQNFDEKTLIKKIDQLFNDLYALVKKGLFPSIDVLIRRRENIIYNSHGNLFFGLNTRQIELGDEYFELIKLLRVAEIVRELLVNDKYSTKREIFYHDPELFQQQKFSDNAIEDLTLQLGTYRDNLHIVASPRGTCVGRLRIRDSNDLIDLKSLGSGGWTISPMLDNIEIIESDAEFILVLEKDATMMRLAGARFWKSMPCILLTAQGSPNYATRAFLKRLVSELKIPAFALCDMDPYGLGILMTYAYGSVQSANETARLAVNNFYWLGVMSKDLESYKIPKYARIRMHKHDKIRGKYMLEEEPLKKNNKLKEQLEIMINLKEKVEIQGFSSKNLDFLEKYIINKIEVGDLIKF